MKRITAVVVMLASSLMAQPLPNAPASHLEPQHKFFDKTNLIGFGVGTGVRIADAAQTCYFEGNPSFYGWHEHVLPTSSCRGAYVYLAVVETGTTVGAAWFFHKTGHHKLERLAPYLSALPSLYGITYSQLTTNRTHVTPAFHGTRTVRF